MTDRQKKILTAAGVAGASLTLVQLGLLGALGGIGPLKGLQKARMIRKPGNAEEYAADRTEKLENSPLEGKRIAFLGSSVTYGAHSLGESFVEYLAKRNGFTYVKEAVSGTTMATKYPRSYVDRMRNELNPKMLFDLFVCQLSTNDAARKVPLGGISTSFDRNDFDTDTVCGAIEYIASYVAEYWRCPLVFYTGTRFDSDRYAQMVQLLFELKDKWGFEIIDLWDSAVREGVTDEQYAFYMSDPVHPTRAGYRDWWTPIMEKELYRIAEEKCRR